MKIAHVAKHARTCQSVSLRRLSALRFLCCLYCVGDDSVSLQRLSALTALPHCLRLGVSEKVVLPRIALCAANSHRCPCTSSEKTSNRILLHWKTNASPALALLVQPPRLFSSGNLSRAKPREMLSCSVATAAETTSQITPISMFMKQKLLIRAAWSWFTFLCAWWHGLSPVPEGTRRLQGEDCLRNRE